MASTTINASGTDQALIPQNSSSLLPEPPGQSSSTFGLLGWLLLALIRILPFLAYWLIKFATITLPTWLFSLLSISLTFTLNFTSLALIVLVVGSTVSWFIRYRYLNMYSRLPPEPQRNQPEVEVFPENEGGGSKPGMANYLDEFLSAIKVFGYLERPVFHELTRSMQTKKLIAGETLLLEEEKGFCLVVDGMVQIFVKSNTNEPSSSEESSDEEDERQRHSQGYQLLTEVGNGAPMSSLFSILSLFTEHLQTRHDGEIERPGTSSSNVDPPLSGMQLASEYGPGTPGSETMSVMGSPRRLNGPQKRERRPSSYFSSSVNEQLPRVPHLSLDPEERADGRKASKDQRPVPPRMNSIHPDIVARATVDTTIAIIPATAFRRLTRIYPKATAHIVSVILTRLQRVTLATAHTYLGLTSEVLRTERLMNKYTTYELPDFLRDSALERLKDKFAKERERIRSGDDSKGIALHNPIASRRRRPKSSLRRESSVRGATAHASSPSHISPPRVKSPESERSGMSAGDLLSNSHLPFGRRPNRLSFSQPLRHHTPPRQDNSVGKDPSYFSAGPLDLHQQTSEAEDTVFRESILECMCKAIGLTGIKDTPMKPVSVTQSPRLISFDSKRQKAVFSNAFGLMEPFDLLDGDTESIASASVSGISGDPSFNLLEELVNDVEIVFFPKDSVLVEQGERNPGLYYVIDGFLDVSVTVDDESPNSKGFAQSAGLAGLTSESQLFTEDRPQPQQNGTAHAHSHSRSRSRTSDRKKPGKRESLFLTKPGGVAGYLGTVTSYRSFIDVTAKTDVYVGFLPRASVERIVDKYPVVLLTMAKRLTKLLPKLIRHIDFALEWVQIDAGQVIYKQEEQSDAIYIVLNGRLRAIREDKSGVKVIGEYGQGDSVGELEVLTESDRPGTLLAIRETELAKLPKSLFNSLAQEHPGITMKISKIIAKRMRALVDDPLQEQMKEQKAPGIRSNPSSIMNLRTVAILPVTAGIPVVDFASRLMAALTQIGTPNGVVSLTQTTILNHLGRHAFSRMGKLKLSQYLADLEEKYGLVIYVADTSVQSPWTQTCISQADCILLVGIADASPGIGEYERFLLTTKTTARKELVLLHSERFVAPGLTRTWLRNRVWINGSHHHIQMATRPVPEPLHTPGRRLQVAIKQRVQTLQAEIQKYTSRRVRETPLYSAETPLKGDFHRLARRLCGKSVGLVLGGGGARGLAHVGVVRALEEAGIPIDIVGGTSIGAFIGGLYAWDADLVPMYGRVKKFAGRMASMWRFALDVTYPSASYTTGHEFNRGIFKAFGNAQVEDFWLDFYCNTTNISKSRADYHNSGYVWRLVRASMSLAGLLPPLCDEGDMLMDGGYIDNLTVTHMKSLGADVIFAVDVGAADDRTPQQYGDTLSGFWILVNRWNPFSSTPNPPTLGEIQARLAYVSSYDALDRAKATPGCKYMRPDVEMFGTLEFSKFNEIYTVGYEYGKNFLAELREQGVLPMMEESEEKKNLRRTMAPRRASI
ncbi:neuropathy target esteras-like protein [Rhizodiscina lignyota]|uniref:Lysophospholipase NTE1 n=1 Tax=Rhizodiscina lignyota TaxID=1504668 RepID=A0A9P4IDH0_9PEZI|nr:neuropathy target esteras-like protein [Rhizodiscina lignyota]